MSKLLRPAALVLLCAACSRPLPKLSRAPDFGQAGLAGQPWIADFIYTTCSGPCPMISANMARLQRDLPPAVQLVSFTVDPKRDTPAVLESYGRRLGADPARWRFVRLPAPRLAGVMQGGFKLALAPGGSAVVHSTKMALVDGDGWIRGYYDGDDEGSLKRLEADARSLVR